MSARRSKRCLASHSANGFWTRCSGTGSYTRMIANGGIWSFPRLARPDSRSIRYTVLWRAMGESCGFMDTPQSCAIAMLVRCFCKASPSTSPIGNEPKKPRRNSTKRSNAALPKRLPNRRTGPGNSRAERALDRFAYITSHDLREPLRTIMRYMQLLQRRHQDQLAETAQEYVGKTIEGARQMNQLITDLHTHSRIGRQGQFTDVDCSAVLAEACGNLRAALEESHATMAADSLPAVRGVKTELLLLFQNLIQNAVKFRADRRPEIRIRARSERKAWLFRVEDNGIGIDAQYLERIFGLGERLHGRKIPGSGFGLANCRKIVEHHGGEIWAESTPGAGSAFRFRLPRHQRMQSSRKALTNCSAVE